MIINEPSQGGERARDYQNDAGPVQPCRAFETNSNAHAAVRSRRVGIVLELKAAGVFFSRNEFFGARRSGELGEPSIDVMKPAALAILRDTIVEQQNAAPVAFLRSMVCIPAVRIEKEAVPARC
jgi:hypothetical protein